MTPAAPFDRNSALRQFNQYFGTLHKQYGSDGLRAMGFMPRDLSALQAALRKLQLDPNSTPEQHQQAYQQARDTLAQRITTPQPTMQTVGQPIREVRPTLPAPEIQLPVPSMPVAPPLPVPETPLRSPPVSKHVDPEGPPSPADIVIERRPPDMLPVSNYIAQMNAPAVPAPTPTFDRNAALQQLNQSFANLRNTYGVDALRGAGFAPSNLSALQADLRKLQLDNSSTQEQHTAALQNALNTMNSFTNNLKPITSPQMAAPTPMPAPMGASLPQEIVVTGAPRPQPEPMPVPAPPPAVPGMYRGGFAVKR